MSVMPGIVPGIQVDGRYKPSHDKNRNLRRELD